MRPSQSDVRREYKSRRVIHPSVCWLQQRGRCMYAHARDRGRAASTHGAGAHGLFVDRSDPPLALVSLVFPHRRSFGGRSFLRVPLPFCLPVHRRVHHHHYREHKHHPWPLIRKNGIVAKNSGIAAVFRATSLVNYSRRTLLLQSAPSS